MDKQLVVQSIEAKGLWLCVDGVTRFLPFADYPWFSNASVAAVFKVERLGEEGLRWPDLDVDILMDSIFHPELYPLVSRVGPIDPSVMAAAIALYEGDEVRAIQWLHKPARSLGGISPIDYLDSPEHVQEVLDIIGRIEHGVFI